MSDPILESYHELRRLIAESIARLEGDGPWPAEFGDKADFLELERAGLAEIDRQIAGLIALRNEQG